jgi:hypothetical protein
MADQGYDALLRLIGEFEGYKGPEQRVERRHATSLIPVMVQPLDAHFQPEGERFQAEVRNISKSGIGLVYGTPVDAPYLLIELVTPSGKKASFIAETRHCTPAGVLIGARFIRRATKNGEGSA